ncbi:MAG: transglycosylase [Proteobacteria bacterium]|nr:transglycosylase [Pseudomonadota bacterium]
MSKKIKPFLDFGGYCEGKMVRFVRFASLFLVVGVLVSGCESLFFREVREPKDALVRLKETRFPRFFDDLDKLSLKEAIQGSIGYFRSRPEKHQVIFGPDTYTVSHVASSLESFLALLDEARTHEEFERLVARHFHVYQSVGHGWRRQVLFTGYYEPVVKGSLIRQEGYPFPLYRRPDDMVDVWLSEFSPEFRNKRIMGRQEGQKLVPYYSREEINGGGVLEGRGYEIAWLADRIDRYFLQIQGSGIVKLQNGNYLRVNYAASNGRSYRSIGKLLIERGEVSRKEMSMQRIRSYLQDNPDKMDETLFHDPSYTFFRVVEKGPLGNINIPLTTGRSIATDSRLFPKGALAFIITEKPVIDDKGEITEWSQFSRFVVNQDTGGAIRGPARVDLFWGEGEVAEISAGNMKQKGKLFFLMAK